MHIWVLLLTSYSAIKNDSINKMMTEPIVGLWPFDFSRQLKGFYPRDFGRDLLTVRPLDLKKLIKDYPDFPKQGVLFRDINPLISDGNALSYVSEEFYRRFSAEKAHGDCRN
jgi:hypothetical protein